MVDASSLIWTISGIHTILFGDGAFWVQELLAGIMPLPRVESFVIPLVNLQAPKAGKHKSPSPLRSRAYHSSVYSLLP